MKATRKPNTFKTRKALVEHLESLGWKVSSKKSHGDLVLTHSEKSFSNIVTQLNSRRWHTTAWGNVF